MCSASCDHHVLGLTIVSEEMNGFGCHCMFPLRKVSETFQNDFYQEKKIANNTIISSPLHPENILQ